MPAAAASISTMPEPRLAPFYEAARCHLLVLAVFSSLPHDDPVPPFFNPKTSR